MSLAFLFVCCFCVVIRSVHNMESCTRLPSLLNTCEGLLQLLKRICLERKREGSLDNKEGSNRPWEFLGIRLVPNKTQIFLLLKKNSIPPKLKIIIMLLPLTPSGTGFRSRILGTGKPVSPILVKTRDQIGDRYSLITSEAITLYRFLWGW